MYIVEVKKIRRLKIFSLILFITFLFNYEITCRRNELFSLRKNFTFGYKCIEEICMFGGVGDLCKKKLNPFCSDITWIRFCDLAGLTYINICFSVFIKCKSCCNRLRKLKWKATKEKMEPNSHRTIFNFDYLTILLNNSFLFYSRVYVLATDLKSFRHMIQVVIHRRQCHRRVHQLAVPVFITALHLWCIRICTKIHPVWFMVKNMANEDHGI